MHGVAFQGESELNPVSMSHDGHLHLATRVCQSSVEHDVVDVVDTDLLKVLEAYNSTLRSLVTCMEIGMSRIYSAPYCSTRRLSRGRACCTRPTKIYPKR